MRNVQAYLIFVIFRDLGPGGTQDVRRLCTARGLCTAESNKILNIF